MLRSVMVAVTAGLLIGGAQAQARVTAPKQAPAPKAECKNFIKGGDGKWVSTIDAKIGNPKDFKLLRKGQPIDRDMTIVGLNVSDTIDQLCGGN